MKEETVKLKFVVRNIPNLNIASWLVGTRFNFIGRFEVILPVFVRKLFK
jgi:hypothetical protein